MKFKADFRRLTVITAVLIAAAMVLAPPASATPFHILTEGDPGGSGNVRIRSFNSLSDLISLNQASTTLLGSNLGGTGVSIGGFTAVPAFVAVPLPATVWMFLTSLGGLVLFDWRRRRVTA
jgi:hypothetical protein